MEEQKKQGKMASVVAIVIVVLVGAYVIWSAVKSADEANNEQGVAAELSQNGEEPDGKGTGVLLQTANQLGEEGVPNQWVDSESLVAFSAPHEWEVHQNDAGSVRFIEIFDPNNLEDVMTIWLQSTHIGSEAGDLTLAQWMELSVQGLSDVEVCDRREIGGIEMACLRATNQKMTWNMYFAELDSKTLIGVFKTQESAQTEKLREVMDSLRLNPSKSDVENAIVIP